MAATIEISETNGATSETASITNSNLGITDAPNIAIVTYAIPKGENSYEKYQRIHVSSMGGATSIRNLKVWRTNSLNAGESHKTNLTETGYSQKSYVTPSRSASSAATRDMPTTEPTGANLGIGGSLAGEITAPGYSDYIVHQIQSTSGATAGSSCTLNFKWDEIT
jgi:hypothetical protein